MVQLVVFIIVWFIGIVSGSWAHGNFLIAILSIGFYWVFQPLNGTPMDIWYQATIVDMPSNISDALLQFDIKSKMVIYAVCPTCHFIYAPQFTVRDKTPQYSIHCMHHPTPESGQCRQPLLRHNKSDPHKSQPIKPFIYHSFHDYLASLLSCKDLKGIMDKACDDLHAASCQPFTWVCFGHMGHRIP